MKYIFYCHIFAKDVAAAKNMLFLEGGEGKEHPNLMISKTGL